MKKIAWQIVPQFFSLLFSPFCFRGSLGTDWFVPLIFSLPWLQFSSVTHCPSCHHAPSAINSGCWVEHQRSWVLETVYRISPGSKHLQQNCREMTYFSGSTNQRQWGGEGWVSAQPGGPQRAGAAWAPAYRMERSGKVNRTNKGLPYTGDLQEQRPRGQMNPLHCEDEGNALFCGELLWTKLSKWFGDIPKGKRNIFFH